MSDTDDGVLPDKDYQPDLPTGTAPDRQRRIAWADDNPTTIDALIAGTLVAVPVEPTNETCIAILEELQRLRSGEDNGLSSRVLYRAMIAEHGRAQPRGTNS